MATFDYIFGDVITGKIISEIPLYGVSMSKSMSTAGLNGSFQLDQTGLSNAVLLESTEPGRCYVVCERDGQPIWGGFISSRTYQSQAKSTQIYAKGFEEYPSRRLIRTDFLNTNIEQRNIFRNLWIAMQNDPDSMQINLPSAFSDVVLKTLDVKAFEFKTYRAAMDELANTSNGFDWSIDTIRAGGVYVHTLRIGYPQLGASDQNNAVVFEYPGSITNYWQNDGINNGGTNIFGLGTGEGSTMLTAEVIHQDLLDSNFPRFDFDVSFKDINDTTILLTSTARAAITHRGVAPTITIEARANISPTFGSYGLGDISKLIFRDPRHPTGETFTSRVFGWEYTPQSADEAEKVRIAFEVNERDSE